VREAFELPRTRGVSSAVPDATLQAGAPVLQRGDAPSERCEVLL